MTRRALTVARVPAAIAFSALLGGPVAGQAGHHLTPWGDPDLQGTWNASGATPMERPAEHSGKATLTDEEVARLESEAEARRDGEPRQGDPGTYNSFWSDRGRRTNQTSMIVDPADGRFPPLTPAGEAARKSRVRGGDTWEDRHLWERCLTRGGMPNAMFPRAYNNNAEIVQAPGYVAILLEEIHEARIIPLDGQPHLPQDVRQWNGDSRGRWEGQTLVVETRNLADRVSALQPWSNFSSTSGSGRGLTMVERFTRVDADTIAYEIAVNDSEMYTKPWTVAFPLMKTTDMLYEYACHESNYGMTGILNGARAEERAAKSGRIR